MRIQHSIPAMNNRLQQMKSTTQLTKTLEKLSSGYRINRAADDAAGLGISEGMRAQIRGLEKGMKNTMDGISLIQVADSALGEVHQYLHRMRELAVQAANDTLVDDDRQLLQLEINQAKEGIDKIVNDTEFNTIKLLNRVDTHTIPTTTSVTTTVPFTKTETISTGTIVNNITLSFDTKLPPGTTFVEFTLNLGTQNTQYFPDLRITSPNGNRFGYNLGYFGNSKGFAVDTTNTSSSKATYTGYESTPEIYTFENPALGEWKLNIVGASSLTSTYTLSATFRGTEDITTPTTAAGPVNNSLKIHTGPNADQALPIQLANVLCESLGIDRLDISTQQDANNAIHQLDEAIQIISNERSKFGAYMNRLDYTHNYLGSYQENLSRAQSTIRDTDMAKAYSNLVKEQLLLQSSTAMFSQIRNNDERILQLLY
ncbi:MAG: flagellin [Solibacillus sp.]